MTAIALAAIGITGCNSPSAGGGEGGASSSSTGTGITDVDDASDGPEAPPDFGDRAQCERFAAPVCGDLQVDAMEECDGSSGCVDCRRGPEPITWLEEDDTDLSAIVPTADGGLAVLWGSHQITRLAADGSEAASWTTVESTQDLAVDAEGHLHGAGIDAWGRYGRPWIASWDSTGSRRWSVRQEWFGGYERAVVEEDRLVVGGFTEQPDAYDSRGLVAQYDLAGALQWSATITSIETVIDVAIVGDEVAVLGEGLLGVSPGSLLRLDADGAVRWSIEVPLRSELGWGAWGMVADGAGGTWIYGEREAGPWARRHDRDGVRVEDLDCLGSSPGIVRHMVVEPGGSVVVAISLSPGVVPLATSTAWLARVEDGVVTWGAAVDDGTSGRVAVDLGRWPDGRLAVGLIEHIPDAARVLEVAP